VISDCIRVAQQAPSASNSQIAHFVMVTDPAKKSRLADIWRRGRLPYSDLPISWQNYRYEDPEHAATIPRMGRSVEHLAANLHRVPVMVIPCVTFRTDGSDVMLQALVWCGAAVRLELLPGGPRARAGDLLDDHPPGPRGRGGRSARHPLSRGHAGCAPARRLHQGHGVQACLQAAGDAGRPLGSVVVRRGAGNENLIALSAWESDRSSPVTPLTSRLLRPTVSVTDRSSPCLIARY
jgi:nitroreductase